MPDQLFLLAERYCAAGCFSDAENVFEQLLAEEPDRADVWHRLGGIAQLTGNFVLARERLNHALSLKPNFVEALSDLGTILQLQGHLPEAIQCFERAIRINQRIAPLHFN